MLQFSLINGLGATIQLPSSFSSKMRLVQAGSEAKVATQAAVKADPLAPLTARLATSIMLKIRRLPEDRRLDYLKAVLDSIDTGLWPTVNETAQGYINGGEDPTTAFLAALTQKLSSTVLIKFAQAAQSRPLQGLGQGLPLNIPAFAQGLTGEAKVDKKLPMIQAGPFTFPVTGDTLTWIYDAYELLTPDQAKFLREVLTSENQMRGGVYRFEDQRGIFDYAERGVKAYTDLFRTPPEPVRFARTYGPSNEEGPGLKSRFELQDKAVIESVWPAGDWLTTQGWLRAIGIPVGSRYAKIHRIFNRNESLPVLTFKRPKSAQQIEAEMRQSAYGPRGPVPISPDEEWGLWINISGVGPEITAMQTTVDGKSVQPIKTQSMALRFMVAKVPPTSIWTQFKRGIASVLGKVSDLLVEIRNEIGDLLCEIANNSGPAVTAGNAYGPGVGTGVAVGAEIIKGQCQAPPPPPEDKKQEDKPEEAKKFPWGPVIAGSIAAVGAVAFVLRGRKPRAT